MLKNYLIITWRSLKRNKLFSFINIAGLSIGLASFVLIYLYVGYELSYDSFHEKSDRLFRVTSVIYKPKGTDVFAPTSPIMAHQITAAFPEVEKSVRFLKSKRDLVYKDKRIKEFKMYYADSTLLDMFTFKFIEGGAKNSLNKPYSIVLTEKIAKQLFGNEPAVGKMLGTNDTISFIVTAVIENIPNNSSLKSDCFISRVTLDHMNKSNDEWIPNHEKNWFNCNTYSYLLLKEGTNPEKFKNKVNTYLKKEMAEYIKSIGMYMNINLEPMRDIHLNSHLDAEMEETVNGYASSVYTFIATAILILLIACCNFINLSTSKSVNRSKEIGLRKVIGAKRNHVIFQFLGESLLITTIAAAISLVLVLIFLPYFNSLSGAPVKLTISIIPIYFLITVIVGLLAGTYPALLMSSFSPVKSLKGHIRHSISDIIFRKGLVVFQFAIAVALIICTSVVLKQLDFIQNRDLGMKKDQLVSLKFNYQDAGKLDLLLKELKTCNNVVAGSLNSFDFRQTNFITLIPEGTPENEMAASYVFSVDENFLKTFQIPILAGRDFSRDFPSDEKDAFIVNEAFVKEFGWKTPQQAIGKKIDWGVGKSGKVIGVVKNFNYSSLKEEIKPLHINIYKPWFSKIVLKVSTNNVSGTLAQIESKWKEIATNSPFRYTFLDEDFNALYQSETRMRSLLGLFTFLSIFIACLGLFGLASFTIKQRFREIGIRKVLGSSISGILALLSKDFLKLVALSILLSIPCSCYLSTKWLENFAFKTNIGVWVFVLSGICVCFIAFITVSALAFKAATTKPSLTLKTE